MTNISWAEGQNACEELGGYLAEPKTEAQTDFLVVKRYIVACICWRIQGVDFVGMSIILPIVIISRLVLRL